MGITAPRSWGQIGTSYHFKSGPLNYFVNGLSYLVLQFLILCLRNRERQRANKEEFLSASIMLLHLADHGLTNPRLGALSSGLGAEQESPF